MRHEPIAGGPLRYPGGKDGMYLGRCSACDYVGPIGTEKDVLKAAQQHCDAKNGT